MKVLITSYSPQTYSSYGTIIRELWSRLLKTGEFEIAQHAWFHSPVGNPVPWKLYLTDGKEEDRFGARTFETVLKQFKPDIVWNLSDIYMSRYIDRFRARYGFRLVRWTLTEGEPIDKDNLAFIKEADECVAITKYASDKWKLYTGKDHKVIYHGVDSDLFKPATDDQVGQLRQDNGIGNITADDFVILFVGRNQTRKRPWLIFEVLHYLRTGAWGWDSQGKAIRMRFDPDSGKHIPNPSIVTPASPIPAFLWMHSFDEGRAYTFAKFLEEWKLTGYVMYTAGLSGKTGLSTEDMVKIYQMSDVLSMISGSEGFGVPIIEAASCGIRSVYTGYSGHGEIGAVCKGLKVDWNSSEPAKFTHVRWVNPDVDQAIEKFYKAYQEKGKLDAGFKMALHEHTKKIFSHDKIVENWLEVLRDVGNRPLRRTIGEIV